MYVYVYVLFEPPPFAYPQKTLPYAIHYCEYQPRSPPSTQRQTEPCPPAAPARPRTPPSPPYTRTPSSAARPACAVRARRTRRSRRRCGRRFVCADARVGLLSPWFSGLRRDGREGGFVGARGVHVGWYWGECETWGAFVCVWSWCLTRWFQLVVWVGLSTPQTLVSGRGHN